MLAAAAPGYDPGMRPGSLALVLVSLAQAAAARAQVPAAGTPAYRDRARPPEERAADLLARMTLDEKLTILSGKGFESRGVPRLGIPEIGMTDGPNGIRWGAKSTAFPVGIAMAATWDPELLGRVGAVLAAQTRAKGRGMLLAPCVNISRVPHNGRNFECFGEDPYLSGRLVAPYVRAVQDRGVIATVKHFACNNQEHRRRDIDVRVSKRALHEIYFPAFEAAVKEGGVHSVMSAYNLVNGEYASNSAYLLRDTLKGRWGFRGFVVSDWDAVQETAATVRAGLDLEMPAGAYLGVDKLKRAMACGAVTEAMIDEMARRILRVLFASGLFDAPPVEDPVAIDTPEARGVALDVARAALVLLKNERAALPLSGLRRLAVIGPGAVYPRTGGGGSGSVRPFQAVRPLDALRAALPGVEVTYTPGVVTAADVEVIPADVFHHLDGGKRVPGLRAEFFNNETWEGPPVLVTRVPGPDLHWSNGSPGPGVNADHFSSRLTGTLTPPQAGRYRFTADANDTFAIYLDGKKVADGRQSSDVEQYALGLDLEARPYDVRIEHKEGTGTAHIAMQWGYGTADVAAAVAAARAADAAVVFAGFSSIIEREAQDHPIELDAAQVELITRVAAANPRTVVVLQTGSPIVIERWQGKVPALVQAWYPGQEGGTAIAEVLTGAHNPSGRLPVTFFQDWKRHPAFGTYPEADGVAPYREGVFVGYRHYDGKRLPVRFAFGHGLSYARFVYRDLKIEASGQGDEARYQVSFEVENASQRAGAEVAQVYVGEARPAVPRPVRELKGFVKLALVPGERRRVSVTLDRRALAYFDEGKDDWVARPGRYEVRVGASSRDLRLAGTLTHR